MNPEYLAASTVHTIPEKLEEYFLLPFTNFLVILIIIIMFSNVYMFRKLWKIKSKDYITLINLITIGIYVVFGIISSVLVSRLGPHGTLRADDCDTVYMFIPRAMFVIVSIINIIYFIINIFTKLKKDKEYKETLERGYFAEENKNDTNEDSENHKTNNVNIPSFIDNIKEKVDIDEIKSKVNHVTENVKDLINRKNDKN